jgi:hypothetical protein
MNSAKIGMNGKQIIWYMWRRRAFDEAGATETHPNTVVLTLSVVLDTSDGFDADIDGDDFLEKFFIFNMIEFFIALAIIFRFQVPLKSAE